MGTTESTARTHLNRVFDKTGVRTQPALVRVLLSAPAGADLIGVLRSDDTTTSPARLTRRVPVNGRTVLPSPSGEIAHDLSC